jgi:ribosomal protein S18 acetylase RimI-like enzyme
MAIPVVEPIISHRGRLGELVEEASAMVRSRSGGRAARLLARLWTAKIDAGMGFVLIDGTDCVGLLLYSADYELRFSSFLSHESAEKLSRSVTIFACHVLERARTGPPVTETISKQTSEQLLLGSAISRLRTIESVETIAVQISPLYEMNFDEPLSRMGFLTCSRVEMERSLKEPVPDCDPPAACAVGPVSEEDIEELRSVVYKGYFSEIDGYLFPDIADVCSSPEIFREFMEHGGIDREGSVMAGAPGYAAGCILVLSGVERRKALIGVVATIPAMRRRGVARAMLVHALKLMKERRLGRAALAVTVENRPAYKLYSSLGFKEAAPRKSISVWRRSVSRPGMKKRRRR